MARKKRNRQTAPAPAELAPSTVPAEPGHSGIRFVYLPQQTAGVRVTEDTALTCAAVWACVRFISEALASLPYGVFRSLPSGGREPAPNHPADWIISTQANPETTAFHWREMSIAHALTWGNAYSEIERDAAGRPVWLWQLTPDRVCVDRDERGRIVYDVRNGSGTPNTALYAEDVLHLKGLGFDGLVGYSVINMAARSIGANIAAATNAASYFANDSTPGGLIKHPQRLGEAARKNLAQSFERRHMGPANRRRVAILEEGMEWVQTSLPPEDSQLVQILELGPTEICRWFRVPPHKIADLTRATFSNIESQEIEAVIDCLMPWARRLEVEADVKLFGRARAGTFYTRHNFNGRLRGDTAARGAFYTQLLDRGILSINDVLELEDRNPIGPDGDKRFVQVNMQLLKNAGEVPPPGAAPAPAPKPPAEPPANGKPKQEPQANGAAKGMAMRPVLEDACKRIARREEHRTKDAVKRLADKPEEFTIWLNGMEEEHRRWMMETLAPIAQALAMLLHGSESAAETALGLYIEGRWRRFVDLACKTQKPDEWLVDFEAGHTIEAADLHNRVLAACAAVNGANTHA